MHTGVNRQTANRVSGQSPMVPSSSSRTLNNTGEDGMMTCRRRLFACTELLAMAMAMAMAMRIAAPAHAARRRPRNRTAAQ
jgi:hypothetical protein